MNSRRLTASALLILLCLVPGCQQASPIERTIQSRQLYTITLEGLNSAHRLGYLPTEQKQKVEPYRKAAADALDAMEREALAGGTNNPFSPFTAAAREFAKAMLEMARAQAEADAARRAVERHATTTRQANR